MNHSTPGLPVHHQLLESTQIHAHWVSDAIQPSHPLSSPFSSCPQSLLASVFSNESTLRIRWPKYWSFSFSIIPSKEHPGLVSFRMDWLDLLTVQGTLKSFLQHRSSKASILWCSVFFIVQLSHPYMTTGKGVKNWASQKHQGPCWEPIPLGPAGVINCTPLSWVSSKVCFATPGSTTFLACWPGSPRRQARWASACGSLGMRASGRGRRLLLRIGSCFSDLSFQADFTRLLSIEGKCTGRSHCNSGRRGLINPLGLDECAAAVSS